MISDISNTPGHPEDLEAYRRELRGLLHIFMIVETLREKYNIKEGEITAACDGLDEIIMAMDRYT